MSLSDEEGLIWSHSSPVWARCGSDVTTYPTVSAHELDLWLKQSRQTHSGLMLPVKVKICLKKITAVGQTFITVKLKKTFFLTFRLLWHTDNQWNNQDNLNITTLDPLRHLQRWVTPVWSFYDVFLFLKFLADLFQIWAPNWIKEEKDSGKSFTTAEIESILLFSIEHILCHTDKQRRRWSWTLNYNHRELWRFDLITVYRYRKSVFRLNVCSFWTNLWILLSLI